MFTLVGFSSLYFILNLTIFSNGEVTVDIDADFVCCDLFIIGGLWCIVLVSGRCCMALVLVLVTGDWFVSCRGFLVSVGLPWWDKHNVFSCLGVMGGAVGRV